jgi:hypothetical protein
VRGDQHIKSCGSQIFKSRSRSTMKRFWSETWKDYKRLYDASIIKIPKENDMFVKVMCFWTLCHIRIFGHIFFVWTIFDLKQWQLIDHKWLYMWKIFHVIWICFEREIEVLKFELQFWSQFLLKVITFYDHHQ